MQEKDIIQGCKSLDRECQKAFVETYSSYLFGICLRYVKVHSDAQDCLQDSLVRILNKIEYFEPSGSFKGWISKVTSNECLQFIRKHRKVNFLDIHETQIVSNRNDIDAKLELDEVLSFLDQLSDKYRIAINMYVIEGFSHKEIAELLNINESSSRSLVARARKMILAEFGNRFASDSDSGQDVIIKFSQDIQSKIS